MPDSIRLREAAPDDAPVLAEFNCRLARETEGLELDLSTVLAGVRRLIDEPALGFYLVAEAEPGVVASLMVTCEWSDWRNDLFWWLQSVYVHPDWRRQGLYRQLYGEVCERARQRGGICGLRLYVEKDNRPARQTYRRTGMRETDYRMYEALFSSGDSSCTN